ncbi:HD domain-containing protein 2-like [Strongylocentrotus purpuratus]|uniref:5'-deoxynucleotidase HDDC2 n=1 Tax=Strongylocentrotus purpuratus TaxID=7668 RepID=A0A7M7N2K7_STRPU|nr:HD domain-containing protein 2-like [Strongylocentrotus purpuratus]
MSASTTQDTLKFLQFVNDIKIQPRRGWQLRGLSNVESVSDHMYQMSVMAMMITDKMGLDKNRCVQMALVHDMAECIVGDITPVDGVSKEEKHRREKETMDKLSKLAGPEAGQELYELWKEYEEQSSPEARFVKDLDRFEMISQAFQYEKRENKPGLLQEFFDSTQGKFNHPLVKEWVEELNTQRGSMISEHQCQTSS